MSSKPLKVVIIGGGATGTGIARLASEHGMHVTLLERGRIGSGTSSRFHGMLHSGARYAVADPEVAADCYRENQILRKYIPSAITDTGGLFVALTDAEVSHADKVQAACKRAGIPFKELSVQTALQREPLLNPKLKRAFSVPDGFIDGAELLRINQKAAQSARFMTGYTVVGFERSNKTITAVSAQNDATGKSERIDCDIVINAAGVWAGHVAGLADVNLTMLFDKGTMIIFKKQLTTAVVNRCRPENDGDLLVPHAGQTIMGTTSRVIADPDDYLPTQEEADVLVHEGSELVPALAKTEALRIYAGVRPLQAHGDLSHDSRSVSRSFSVLDHADQGVSNMLSVVGGKVTLYRLMAETTVEAIKQKSGYASNLAG